MRTVVIEGTPYQVPARVSRVQNGWQFRGQPTRFFSDSKCGGIRAALAEAAAMAAANPARPRLRRGLGTVEREDKSRPTGHVGIFATYRPARVGHAAEHYLTVVTDRRVNIYVGTEATASANYETAMARALQVRKEWERRRNTDGTKLPANAGRHPQPRGLSKAGR